jgi:uncharacterized Zn-binding protein involved in type VI secretion
MALKIFTVGDKTDHGGQVISGSPIHTIAGLGPAVSVDAGDTN